MLDDFAVEIYMGYPVFLFPGPCEDSCTGQAYVVDVFEQVVDFVSGHPYEDAVVIPFYEREDEYGGYRDFCPFRADVYHVFKYSKTYGICKRPECYK